MLSEGGRGDGGPSPEWFAAAATLVAFVGNEYEDSPRNMWGGRTASEAREAVKTLLGLSDSQFDAILHPEARDADG